MVVSLVERNGAEEANLSKGETLMLLHIEKNCGNINYSLQQYIFSSIYNVTGVGVRIVGLKSRAFQPFDRSWAKAHTGELNARGNASDLSVKRGGR